ncbi:hypothetical protein V6Z12_A10G216700 [Gossypium hirsutum]
MISFFKIFYYTKAIVPSNFPIHEKFPSIDQFNLDLLSIDASFDEMRRALFDMTPLKALGIDGLNAQYFQTQWDLLGPSLVGMVWILSSLEPSKWSFRLS